MSGKCLDSDEHSFIFDEVFLKEIENIVTKHKINLEEIRKLKIIGEELRKEADEFSVKTKELNHKYDSNNERINNLYNFIIDFKNEVK